MSQIKLTDERSKKGICAKRKLNEQTVMNKNQRGNNYRTSVNY